MASRRAASSLRRCSSVRRASSSARKRRSSASRAARSADALASASARATASLSASSSLIRFSSKLINSLSEKRTELSFCSAIFRVSSIRHAESAVHFTQRAYQPDKSFVKHSHAEFGLRNLVQSVCFAQIFSRQLSGAGGFHDLDSTNPRRVGYLRSVMYVDVGGSAGPRARYSRA